MLIGQFMQEDPGGVKKAVTTVTAFCNYQLNRYVVSL